MGDARLSVKRIERKAAGSGIAALEAHMKTHWSKALVRIGACNAAVLWASGQKSRKAAWENCEVPGWLLFALDKLGKPTEREWRLLACAFARMALPCVQDVAIRAKLAEVIEVAERYARGEATREELSAAYSVADSVAHSAAWSAADSVARSAAYSVARSVADSAAYSAAYSAADSVARSAADSVARSAAYSVAWSVAHSAAWQEARKEQCNIIRAMFPMPVLPLRQRAVRTAR